jgi:hypothetical protein
MNVLPSSIVRKAFPVSDPRSSAWPSDNVVVLPLPESECGFSFFGSILTNGRIEVEAPYQVTPIHTSPFGRFGRMATHADTTRTGGWVFTSIDGRVQVCRFVWCLVWFRYHTPSSSSTPSFIHTHSFFFVVVCLVAAICRPSLLQSFPCLPSALFFLPVLTALC